MEIEDILSAYAGKDTRLDADSYAIMYGSGYVFTPDTPPAIKREIQFIYASLSKNPESVDLHDPYVVEAFSKIGLNQIDDLYYAFGVLRKNNIPYDHLPHSDVFTTCIDGIPPREFEPTSAFELRMFEKLIDGPFYQPWVKTGGPEERATLVLLESLETRYRMCKAAGKEKIIEAIIDTKLPPSMIPTKIIQDPTFLERYCSHIGIQGEEKDALIEVLSTQYYSQDLERKLSSILGHDSLDRTISTEILNNPQLNDVASQYGSRDKSKDIVLLAAIKLNAVKMLHSKGIHDIEIDMNVPKARGAITPAANYNHEAKRIRIFTSPLVGIQEHAKSIIHEVDHAIQDQNLRTNNIKEDPDIDFYAMDRVIRMISDETTCHDYYVDNTYTISYEYDADYKAAIYTYNLKNMDKPQDQLLNDLKDEIRGRKEKSQTILAEIESTTPYKLDRSRIYSGKRMDIEDAFRTAVESTIERKPTLWQKIRAKIDTDFPILKFKYSFEDGRVHKLTPEELVERLSETVDEKDREVYMGLIRNSMSPRKDRDSEKNIETCKRLTEDPSIPIDIRGDVKSILSTTPQNKYEQALYDTKHERKC